MKVTYHIPTESFGYVEHEYEGEDECITLPTYDQVRHEVMLGVGKGMEELAFSRLVDKYDKTKTMLPEEHEALNVFQRYAINTFKKLYKRQNGN